MEPLSLIQNSILDTVRDKTGKKYPTRSAIRVALRTSHRLDRAYVDSQIDWLVSEGYLAEVVGSRVRVLPESPKPAL